VPEISTFPPFTEMSAEQFQAHLDERSVNTHDAASVARWFTVDGVQRLMASGEAATGRQQIEERMADLFRGFPDFHLQVRDLFSVADRMCAECTATGTHEDEFAGLPATGRQVELDWCLVFRFDADGLVVEENVYGDMATMLRQLGVLPGA
jgi:steroid delta-isomerase-like uncharacterized protein